MHATRVVQDFFNLVCALFLCACWVNSTQMDRVLTLLVLCGADSESCLLASRAKCETLHRKNNDAQMYSLQLLTNLQDPPDNSLDNYLRLPGLTSRIIIMLKQIFTVLLVLASHATGGELLC